MRILINCIMIMGFIILPMGQISAHKAPNYQDSFVAGIKDSVFDKGNVSGDNTLIENIQALFYPGGDGTDGGNRIYKVIRDLTLGIMIIYIVRAGASLLFNLNKKSEDLMKTLWSIVYMIIGGAFVYGASRLFGSVLKFNGDPGRTGLSGAADAITGSNGAIFQVLATIKGFAFFLAIVMIIITGVRVIMAGEQDKGKKLVKGLINVVVALIVIKGIDFVYYMAMDAETFIAEASDFIINVAKLFGYLYGIVIVIMVFVAGYLYLTDGGNGNGFKKACNILVNIVLSALVLFSFLLILYQIFAEFGPGGEAVATS